MPALTPYGPGENKYLQSKLRLDTLPPEVRSIIYTYLGHDAYLNVLSTGGLRVTDHLMHLGAVSHPLRDEVSPLLRGINQTHLPILICENGLFPDNIRRRIPNRVLHKIELIIIQGKLRHDDLKPTWSNFPKLSELRIRLESIWAPNFLERRWYLPRTVPGLSEAELEELVSLVKEEGVMEDAAELHWEQERPREGLERDYFVDGTLFQILTTTRQRRGFDIVVEADVYHQDIHGGARPMAFVWIDSWDLQTGGLEWR